MLQAVFATRVSCCLGDAWLLLAAQLAVLPTLPYTGVMYMCCAGFVADTAAWSGIQDKGGKTMTPYLPL